MVMVPFLGSQKKSNAVNQRQTQLYMMKLIPQVSVCGRGDSDGIPEDPS